MVRTLLSAAALLFAVTLPAGASEITGQYVEARTCDVYTGACFANADTGIAGKHAVLAWKVERGNVGSAKLDGLGIVAVIASKETLGMKQHLTPKSIVLVDAKASAEQRDALIEMARQQAGNLLGDIISVRSAPINIEACPCKNDSCAKVETTGVKVETRCLNKDHDRGCGNDCNYFPPLSKSVKARTAMAVENTFSGKEFNETWSDAERRGAYVGTFAVR